MRRKAAKRFAKYSSIFETCSVVQDEPVLTPNALRPNLVASERSPVPTVRLQGSGSRRNLNWIISVAARKEMALTILNRKRVNHFMAVPPHSLICEMVFTCWRRELPVRISYRARSEIALIAFSNTGVSKLFTASF